MAPPREKIFEKVALKQRLDVMRKSRSLAVLREELQKTESLCEQLDGILKDIVARTGEQSVASLRADSWYRCQCSGTAQNAGKPRSILTIRNSRCQYGTGESTPQRDPRPRCGENSKTLAIGKSRAKAGI